VTCSLAHNVCEATCQSSNAPHHPPWHYRHHTHNPACRYMITRNLDQQSGLVNGVQVVCESIRSHTVSVRMPSGHVHVIPRITCVIAPNESGLPFALSRRQFPLTPSYALTVHRVQGQTLKRLGVYFTGEPFCHGLLFTALSRVRSWENVAVWLDTALPRDAAFFLKNMVRRHIVAHLQQQR
jgi:ATP-dependent exoDNAse (exonuclease V) alpha subunit